MLAVYEMTMMVYVWDLLKPSGVTGQISNLAILIAQHKQILHMIKLEKSYFPKCVIFFQLCALFFLIYPKNIFLEFSNF